MNKVICFLGMNLNNCNEIITNLNSEILDLQAQLHSYIDTYGLGDLRTIKKSQELDVKLNLFNSELRKERRSSYV